MPTSRAFVVLVIACVIAHRLLLVAQAGNAPPVTIDHAAIQYMTRPTRDAVAELNKKIQAGRATLAFDGRLGYLRSVLAALDVPVESQTLVYSPTSVQAEHISETTPRALYFN